ncbi:MAG: ABC transporter C-terminal domain-containing protein, partial [Pirellulales bacterium]
YLHLVRRGLAGKSAQPAPAGAAKPAARKSRAEKPARPPRRFPYRKLVEIEAEICQRESRLEALHARLSEPEVLRDGRRAKEIQAEAAAEQASLTSLYEHWEEASQRGD